MNKRIHVSPTKYVHTAVFQGTTFTVTCTRRRYVAFVGCVMDGKAMKVGWHRSGVLAYKDLEKTQRTWVEATQWGVVEVKVSEV